MKRKNEFKCGHKGLGKYCHLCKEIELGRLKKLDSGKYEQVGKNVKVIKEVKEEVVSKVKDTPFVPIG